MENFKFDFRSRVVKIVMEAAEKAGMKIDGAGILACSTQEFFMAAVVTNDSSALDKMGLIYFEGKKEYKDGFYFLNKERHGKRSLGTLTSLDGRIAGRFVIGLGNGPTIPIHVDDHPTHKVTSFHLGGDHLVTIDGIDKKGDYWEITLL